MQAEDAWRLQVQVRVELAVEDRLRRHVEARSLNVDVDFEVCVGKGRVRAGYAQDAAAGHGEGFDLGRRDVVELGAEKCFYSVVVQRPVLAFETWIGLGLAINCFAER